MDQFDRHSRWFGEQRRDSYAGCGAVAPPTSR